MSDYVTETFGWDINGIEFVGTFELEFVNGYFVNAELKTEDDTLECMFMAFNLDPYEIVMDNVSDERMEELAKEARWGKPNWVDHSGSIKAIEAMLAKEAQNKEGNENDR